MGSETEPKKEGRGRPTKYDPAFCEQAVEAMRSGLSLTGFAGQLGVSRATINVWADQHPDFLEALNVGKAARTWQWENKALRVGENGGGPGTATIITFMLKNMAPDEYREKVEHSHGNTDDKPFRTQNETTLRADLTVEQLRILEGILAPPAEPE